jgi:hypothetical protein
LFTHMLDISILYPQNTRWPMMDMLCGNMKRIVIDVKVQSVSPQMVGDYQGNQQFRDAFREQLNTRWAEKDARITQFL